MLATKMVLLNAMLTAIILVSSTSRKIPILYDGLMMATPSSC
jgi:hypothetical protein